jgi:hypothetical protein
MTRTVHDGRSALYVIDNVTPDSLTLTYEDCDPNSPSYCPWDDSGTTPAPVTIPSGGQVKFYVVYRPGNPERGWIHLTGKTGEVDLDEVGPSDQNVPEQTVNSTWGYYPFLCGIVNPFS